MGQAEKQERTVKVNNLIRVIGDCGRGFFYSKSKLRYASIEVDLKGHAWWTDDYSGKRVYTHGNHRWFGFTHGGTLRNVVENFRDYISKGKPIRGGIFGPWPETYCNGDLWGYGKDNMAAIKAEALRLGILEP
jgi:hypothetical protein